MSQDKGIDAFPGGPTRTCGTTTGEVGARGREWMRCGIHGAKNTTAHLLVVGRLPRLRRPAGPVTVCPPAIRPTGGGAAVFELVAVVGLGLRVRVRVREFLCGAEEGREGCVDMRRCRGGVEVPGYEAPSRRANGVPAGRSSGTLVRRLGGAGGR